MNSRGPEIVIYQKQILQLLQFRNNIRKFILNDLLNIVNILDTICTIKLCIRTNKIVFNEIRRNRPLYWELYIIYTYIYT